MNLFLQACGSERPMRLDINGKGRVFPRPYLVIGRDPRSDFVLDHPEVSRRHAYIQMLDGHLFCCDLGSRTGFQWDGGGSARAGWLGRDRGIRIGPFSIRPSAPSSEDRPGGGMPPDRPSPLETPFPDAPILMETTLESPQGVVQRNGVTVHRIGRVLSLVGRSPECEPYLFDPSVSWLHCSLVRTPVGTWVIDLVGRGGIAVNGVSVRFARLADGDEIGVGYHSVRVRLNDRSPAPERRENFPARVRASRPDGPEQHGPSGVARPPMISGPGSQAPRPTALAPFVEPGGGLAEAIQDGPMLTNAALMSVMNQFGMQQRQMLEQFFQTMMTMFQMSSSMHREEQESIRREIGELCKLSEELAEVRAEIASLRPSAAAGRSPRGVGNVNPPDGRERGPSAEGRAAPAAAAAAPQGDFYDWLSSRMETLQGEQQSRWQSLMNHMLGRRHGAAPP